ncbi:MAG TPA: nucleotidyltransferase family protein [bacterium]|nr:nucleotidyltransferase family protein [bacterium]
MHNAAKTKQDVLDRLHETRERIAALGVERLGLFGSFVHDTQTAASDVDILVEFQPGGKSFDHFMDLCFLLEDVLGREVELVTKESLSPYIGPHILKEIAYVPVAA